MLPEFWFRKYHDQFSFYQLKPSCEFFSFIHITAYQLWQTKIIFSASCPYVALNRFWALAALSKDEGSGLYIPRPTTRIPSVLAALGTLALCSQWCTRDESSTWDQIHSSERRSRGLSLVVGFLDAFCPEAYFRAMYSYPRAWFLIPHSPWAFLRLNCIVVPVFLSVDMLSIMHLCILRPSYKTDFICQKLQFCSVLISPKIERE